MAVSTSTIHSFSMPGVPGVVSEFNKFESTTSPKRAVGFKVEDQQGNIYRWAHFGAAVTQGKVVSQDISESSLVDSDGVAVAPAGTTYSGDNAVGGTHVQLTVAAVTADQFAGGKLIITDDTGEGYTYDILGNTATDDPSTGTIRLELKDKLQAALGELTDVAIIGSKYANLEAADQDADVLPAGVTVASQASADYGWIQTKGRVGILQEGTVAVHNGITIGTVAGAVKAAASDTTARIIGSCVIAGDDTGYGGFDINCE